MSAVAETAARPKSVFANAHGNVQAPLAMGILGDPEREFAASVFLRFEVLPQAVFNK